jgi:hypothetical protein
VAPAEGTTMSNPDETLGAIDDVIADWQGSLDAMVWTADPPKTLDPSGITDGLRLEPEAARRVFEGLSAARRVVGDAARPVAASMTRGLAQWARSPAVQQMIALAESPEVRAMMEAHERGEEA